MVDIPSGNRLDGGEREKAEKVGSLLTEWGGRLCQIMVLLPDAAGLALAC
jgi:hypothetical protein